jgi:hypothetical protein
MLTADYVHYVRSEIEAAYPHAFAIFMNGCCGDINNGHKAHDSWTLAANSERTFVAAERVGRAIGKAALAAGEAPVGDTARGYAAEVTLRLTRVEAEPLPVLAQRWRAELDRATDKVEQIVLRSYIGWAEKFSNMPPGSWTGRVSLLDWGGVPIVALPGEIFTETGLSIRGASGGVPAFDASYADGTPG